MRSTAPSTARKDSFSATPKPMTRSCSTSACPRRTAFPCSRQWRAAGRVMPVLILTARDRWSEKVQGFDAGADDYVSKPFHMEEVLARIRALLRRAAGHATNEIVCGPVRLDTKAGRVVVDGAPVKLTSHEYRLLAYLMHHSGRVVSRSEIIEHLYDQDFDRDSNTIEVFVGRLRKKLGVDLIQTVRGLGYMAAPSAEESRRKALAAMRLPSLPARSIATRLFLTAAALSSVVLLLASLFFTTYYRQEAEEVFERRLDVYLRAIVADVSEFGTGRPHRAGTARRSAIRAAGFGLVLADHADATTRRMRSRRRARSSPSACRNSPTSASPAEVGGLRRGYRAGAGRAQAAHRGARDRRRRHGHLSRAGRRQRRGNGRADRALPFRADRSPSPRSPSRSRWSPPFRCASACARCGYCRASSSRSAAASAIASPAPTPARSRRSPTNSIF